MLPNNSFKPTPCRGIGHVLYATLAHVRRPATGRLNSGVRCVKMLIERDKISKSSSFILRSSLLEEAMHLAGISTDTSLHHVSSSIFFDAHFWPPRPNVPYERFYIRAGCVPTIQSNEARLFVETHVIPSFIDWASGILSLPNNSPVRRSQQAFGREFDRAHT